MLKKLLFAVALVIFASAVNSQTIWEENFNTGTTFPAGWTQQTLSTDGGWKIGAPSALSSNGFPIPANDGNVMATNDDKCQTCNKTNDLVIMPVFDLTAFAGAELYLTFDLFFAKLSYNGKTESLDVMASTDSGTTWISLKSLKGRPFWVKPSGVDVSAYAGQSSVLLAFKYNDGGDWLYGAAVDNVKLVVSDNLVKVSASGVGLSRYIDAIPTYVEYPKFWVDGEMSISGSMNNVGFVNINSFDVIITDGNSTIVQNYDSLDIPFDENYEFAIPYIVKPGANDLSITVANINDGSDNDPSDNGGDASVIGVTPAQGRKVLVEEGTGTWCIWCPRGAVMMDFMNENYPESAVLVAVHNGDPMKVTAYDTPISQIIPGYPGGLVDRIHNVDPLEFEYYFIDRMTEAPTVAINQNVDWDAATRTATVTSYVKFLENLDGDYRIAIVYTENDVTGTSSTYAQKNSYSGGGNGPMGGYENLPATVPASQMVYEHVARAILPTFDGQAGSVPASNPAGSVVGYISSYTVPAAYDINEMHAITLLIDNASGEIVNAEQTAIPNVFVGTNDPNQLVSVGMFPNPVQDEATIKLRLAENSDVQVRVVDALGKVALERNYSDISGEQQLPFRVGNLAAGTYMLAVTAKGQTVTKTFVIVR